MRRPYVVCAFIVRSSYEFDPRGGYKCKDRGKHQAYIHNISTEAHLFVMAIILQRVAILRRMLRDEEESQDAILDLLIASAPKKTAEAMVGQALDRATSPKMNVTFHQPIWIVLLDE